MLVAGDASGDMLAGELISALRARLGTNASFFGAGGPAMQAAGMELVDDFTRNAVFGFDAILRIWEFRRRFQKLLQLAIERRPDAIVGVDFSGFNCRFAHAVLQQARPGSAWKPRLIQYVSPQVWASRPGRADKLARDIDLLISIFPFEKTWYAARTPGLRVEFVGHPMIDRFANQVPPGKIFNAQSPLVLLLPGSRPAELRQHLPILRDVLRHLRQVKPGTRAVVVLPEKLLPLAREVGLPENVDIQSQLPESLARADLAIAKSGTVTLECAFFGIPTVVFYRTSALTYAIAKRIVSVKWVAMPNLLANEEVFPEFVQQNAVAENISAAALELMTDDARRTKVQSKLREIAASLGTAGASDRAAQEIIKLVTPS